MDAIFPNRKEHFEVLHLAKEEPWNYSRRAIEILRHKTIVETVRSYCPEIESIILDIGCSTGQLTRRIAEHYKNLYAIDVSPAAIKKAEQVSMKNNCAIHFSTGNSTQLPYETEFFNIVIISDGLYEWYPEITGRTESLKEANRVLKKNGFAIFTDYLRTEQFGDFVKEISVSPFRIVEVSYLYDRLWYQFESWFKAVNHWNWVEKLLSSLIIARFLQNLSKCFGKYCSKHILVVAQKTGEKSRS